MSVFFRAIENNSGCVNENNSDSTGTCEAQDAVVGTSATVEGEPASKKRRVYIGDFKENPLSERELQFRASVMFRKNQLIRSLRQRNTRLNRRVSNMETLLMHLKRKHLISDETSLTLTVCSTVNLTFFLEKSAIHLIILLWHCFQSCLP